MSLSVTSVHTLRQSCGDMRSIYKKGDRICRGAFKLASARPRGYRGRDDADAAAMHSQKVVSAAGSYTMVRVVHAAINGCATWSGALEWSHDHATRWLNTCVTGA